MTLKKYEEKRDLKQSHEPNKKTPLKVKAKSEGVLNFCVQKHDASHLHYDFRLEYKGVLLSWAVPKGPSLNPQDKRLAVHVEDHPLAYQYFEGVIPKGNYGAGTVEIWDRGTFTTLDGGTKSAMEKTLGEGLKKGHISFIMHGEKLKGEFTLQKLKKSEPDDKNWLLIKKNDFFADPDHESLTETKIKTVKKSSKKKVKIPDFISPMLATLVKEPFDGEDWLFEVKWDGYRAVAYVDNKKVILKSRNNIVWKNKFLPVENSLKKITEQVIFDGELVVLDERGKSHFQLMQNYYKQGLGNLVYCIFDLLFLNGEDLRTLPLIERKELLKDFLNKHKLSHVLYSDHILHSGTSFFKAAAKETLEGIMAKKLDSTYQSTRSRDWLKIKTILRQEVVIGGFTEPRGSRAKLGALLVGVYNEKGEFEYAGHVGGGFTGELLEDVSSKLQPLIQTKCPFKNKPITNMPATWVKPKLIAEVTFTEWTEENSMRHPVFQGIRTDKEAKSVKKEIAEKIPKEAKTKTKIKSPADLSNEELTLTNLEKVYWPEENYTKGDLINYYRSISDTIIPYLKNRPIMLHRYPNGIEGTDFYQKDLSKSHPAWIKTFAVQHDEKTDDYLLIDDKESLLYAVNLGSIDLHPFLSNCNNIEHPDFCVFDLDPHDVEFKDLIETALVLHEILEQTKIPHFIKTSGGKGLHILIPLGGKYDYDQSRQFAEILGHLVNVKLPKTTSLERDPKKRPHKIYLDCLQNRRGQTIVAPYSVRPRPHAKVSTPLDWSEVTPKLDLEKFTIKTLKARLKKKGDLLKGLINHKGIDLQKTLKDLQKLM